MKNIGLLGCGQLGSRHLQSLANLSISAQIYAYDISPEALQIAKSRYDEVKNTGSPICVYTSELTAFPNDFDMIIIACSSLQRLELIRAITRRKTVRYMILEKILFPRLEEYDIAEEIFARGNISSWVNCNKSSNNTFFSALKKKFDEENPAYIQVEGGDWGIGCNAIHFIHLFRFLTGVANVAIDSSGLLPEITEAKRNGYLEFYGTLKVSSGTHRMELTSIKNGEMPLLIHLDSGVMRAQLSFGERLKGKIQRRETNWNDELIDCVIYKQSQLTSALTEDILRNQNCALPKYEKSKADHISLLNSLIAHMDRCNYPHLPGECLIT